MRQGERVDKHAGSSANGVHSCKRSAFVASRSARYWCRSPDELAWPGWTVQSKQHRQLGRAEQGRVPQSSCGGGGAPAGHPGRPRRSRSRPAPAAPAPACARRPWPVRTRRRASAGCRSHPAAPGSAGPPAPAAAWRGGGAAAAASVRVCGYIVGVAACAPQARPPRDDKAGRDCGQGKHQIVPNASKTGQSPQRGAEEQCAGGSAHPAPPLWQPQHVSHAAGVDAPTARLCDHHRPFILQLILPQVEPLQAGLGRHARRHRRRPLRGDLIQRQLQLLRGRSAGATGGYTRQTTCRGLPRGRPC